MLALQQWMPRCRRCWAACWIRSRRSCSCSKCAADTRILPDASPATEHCVCYVIGRQFCIHVDVPCMKVLCARSASFQLSTLIAFFMLFIPTGPR